MAAAAAAAGCCGSIAIASCAGSSKARGAVAAEKTSRRTRGSDGYERIGERVSIFQIGPVWYANYQEGGKQRRTSLKVRNHEVARQKARALEAQLSGAVPRQAGAFDIATVEPCRFTWK